MARAVRRRQAVPVRRSAARRVPVTRAATGLSVDQVNGINIGLMLVSAATAWVAPFELLLFSYAVLGPLHYLTEISWLHDRRYFTTGRYQALVLAALGGLAFAAQHTSRLPTGVWVVLAFALAGVFAFPARRAWKAGLTVAALLACLALQRWETGWFFLVILLPTVIHVFCFTGCFILHGSIKSRSAWGYASFVVFLVCGIGLLLYRPPAAHYSVSPHTAETADVFGSVFDQLAMLTAAPNEWSSLVAIGRFLGFAYTYHYLNWFSKTGVIRWHVVSGARLAAIGALYVAALALYAYDYRVGLEALFFLSLVHVLLEFPLDLRTIAALAGRPVAT